MNVRNREEDSALRAESITRRLIDTLGADAVSIDPAERQATTPPSAVACRKTPPAWVG